MFRPRPFRVSPRRRHRLLLRLLLLALVVLSLDVLAIARRPTNYPPPYSVASLRGTSAKKEQVFIASLVWNSVSALQDFWKECLLETIEVLGTDNVHVSIHEDGSRDGTREELDGLEQELNTRGIKNKVKHGDETHVDIMNDMLGPLISQEELASRRQLWVGYGGRWEEEQTEDAKVKGSQSEKSGNDHQPEKQVKGKQKTRDSSDPLPNGVVQTKNGPEVRRIPYLARLRNEVMDDMLQIESETGKRFDKVLWLNDVKFKPADVVTLLHTAGGDYAAACALDYKLPHEFYDTFATREVTGQPIGSRYWPYFSDSASQAFVMSGQPVPVRACWGGMLAFDAAPFYASQAGAQKKQSSPAAPAHGLRFRGVSDALAQLHIEGSESCLVHADNPLSADKGVFVNPRVRVAYSKSVYDEMRIGRHRTGLIGLHDSWKVVWRLRWKRMFGNRKSKTLLSKIEKRWRGRSMPSKAEADSVDDVYGRGKLCTIDEQHVLRHDGWAHT